MTLPKEYLADGVYVEHDGFGISVTTENGIEVTNEIYFEPETYNALAAYVKRIQEREEEGPQE